MSKMSGKVVKKSAKPVTAALAKKPAKNLFKVPNDLRAVAWAERQKWHDSLPAEFKAWKHPMLGKRIKPKIGTKSQRRIRKEFLRAGVPWPWEKVRMPQWSHVMALRGRRCDHFPKEFQSRIAVAMKKMPDIIASYRQEVREYRFQRNAARRERMRMEKEEAANLMTMQEVRELVDQFDASDNIWEICEFEVDPYAEAWADQYPECFPESEHSRDLEGRFADEEVVGDERRLTCGPGFEEVVKQMEKGRLEEEARELRTHGDEADLSDEEEDDDS